MEEEKLIQKTRNRLSNISLITLIIYILDFINRRTNISDILTFAVILILLFNLVFIIYSTLQIYKNKSLIKNFRRFYTSLIISFVVNLGFMALIGIDTFFF